MIRDVPSKYHPFALWAYSKGGTLGNVPLFFGEVIATDALDANYKATDIASAWAKYSALNAIVPERILKPPTGSRGDIEQAAIWEDGTWYTEITRKLVTGHDDDVQFDDLSKTYAFGIATMDNTGGGGHNTHGSTKYHLAFDIESELPTDEEAPPADEEKPGDFSTSYSNIQYVLKGE